MKKKRRSRSQRPLQTTATLCERRLMGREQAEARKRPQRPPAVDCLDHRVVGLPFGSNTAWAGGYNHAETRPSCSKAHRGNQKKAILGGDRTALVKEAGCRQVCGRARGRADQRPVRSRPAVPCRGHVHAPSMYRFSGIHGPTRLRNSTWCVPSTLR